MIERLTRRLTQWRAALRRDRTALDCTRALELLPLHAAGDLRTDAAQRVAQHLAACARCRAEADAYAASRAWLTEGAQVLFEDEFYDGLRAEVLRQIARDQRPAPPQRAPLFAPLFAPTGRRAPAYVLASVALVVLVGAVVWLARARHDGTTPQSVAEVNEPTPAAVPASPGVTPQTPSPTQIKPDDNQNDPRTGVVATADQLAQRQRASSRPFIKPERVLANTPRPRGAAADNANAASAANVSAANASNAAVVAAGNTTAASAGNSSVAARAPGAQDATPPAPRVEIARIEFQTADPNIRIIWLAPAPDAADARTEPNRQ
ncbi:MAG TPA: zf-HC2 domain-containing protein [Pyrinomonadaceae bacterium]|jgi:hypothetical protein